MTDRLKRLKFRAWHRGTREADYMIGGFFDRYAATWSEDEIAWYEIVVEEDDVEPLREGGPIGHHEFPREACDPMMNIHVACPRDACARMLGLNS
eukprot:gene46434-biopygen39544